MRKLFQISYGRSHHITGHVWAASHEEVQAYLRSIGWPILSVIVELPVMELTELPQHLERLRTEATYA